MEHVTETLRPLPVEPLGQAPAYVLGLARLRGEAVPVVDAQGLLGGAGGESNRWLGLRVGRRKAALAVKDVLGIRSWDEAQAVALPPLLAPGAPEVQAVAALDAELMLLLQAAKLVPEEPA